MFSKSSGQSSCQPSVKSPYSILRSQSSDVSSCRSAGENSSLSLIPYVPCASTVHFREQPDVLITRAAGKHIPHQHHVLLRSGCGWTATSPCLRNRTCIQKLRMTILDCLLTDCGIFSLHRTPPSHHSNFILCSNLRSFLNSQATSLLCYHCACCLSRPLATPSTGEL
jgi:hypothetical protein